MERDASNGVCDRRRVRGEKPASVSRLTLPGDQSGQELTQAAGSIRVLRGPVVVGELPIARCRSRASLTGAAGRGGGHDVWGATRELETNTSGHSLGQNSNV